MIKLAFANSIKGIDKLIEVLPQEYQFWDKFNFILILDYECDYDYIEEKYFSTMNIVVTDDDDKYKIKLTLKQVYGEIKFEVGKGPLQSLDIIEKKSLGYESDSRFHVYDYENDDFSIWCNEIEAEIIR